MGRIPRGDKPKYSRRYRMNANDRAILDALSLHDAVAVECDGVKPSHVLVRLKAVLWQQVGESSAGIIMSPIGNTLYAWYASHFMSVRINDRIKQEAFRMTIRQLQFTLPAAEDVKVAVAKMLIHRDNQVDQSVTTFFDAEEEMKKIEAEIEEKTRRYHEVGGENAPLFITRMFEKDMREIQKRIDEIKMKGGDEDA